MQTKKNYNEIVVEATKRIKSDETVIFLDKTPKSLYEYHLNHYTVEDILKLADNLRMEFEAWDRMHNFYQSSNSIMEISGDDIAVIYEDYENNQFIYSFAKKRIYYYDRKNPPYIDLNQELTVKDFLDVAKRDFIALLRTPYGKKYVTESAVVFEGLMEVLGNGDALRIFIDKKTNKDQCVYDKHSYAFIDALLNYSDNLITESEYDKMLQRKNHIMEVYTNRKLGSRDELRRMCAKEDALDRVETGSLLELMDKYNQDPESIYDDYFKIRYSINVMKSAMKDISSYVKKNSLSSACGYFYTFNSFKQSMPDAYLNEYIKDPMIMIDKLENDFIIMAFSEKSFYNAINAKRNSKFDKLSSYDVHDMFMATIEAIVNIIKANDKQNVLHPVWVFDKTRETCQEDNDAYVKIKLSFNPMIENRYAPMPKGVNSMLPSTMVINKVLFEYFTDDKKEYSDEYIGYIISEANKDLDVTLNTLSAVLEDRSTYRSVAHNVRSGVEKVTKFAKDSTHTIRGLVARMHDGAQDLMDELQHKSEETDREIAITNSFFLKMRRFVISCLTYIGSGYMLFGVVGGLIGAVVRQCMKNDDDKTKAAVVRELEVELKITREKIDDAKSDNNKQAKYQLMRLESQIENDIARIKYGNH